MSIKSVQGQKSTMSRTLLPLSSLQVSKYMIFALHNCQRNSIVTVSAGTHGLVAYNLLQSYDQLLHEYWYIIVSYCIISLNDKQTSRQIHHIHIIVVTDSKFLFKATWCDSFITDHTPEYHNHSPSCLNFWCDNFLYIYIYIYMYILHKLHYLHSITLQPYYCNHSTHVKGLAS